MIECSEENIWLTKKCSKTRKRKKILALIIFFVITLILYVYYKNVIVSQIFSICTEKAYSYSVASVNQAVLESVSAETKYQDLVNVSKNPSGEIELISLNSVKINTINREIAENSNEILTNRLKNGIDVPILSFLGLGIFNGYGPPVNIKTLSVSSVVCDFKSVFESVGINQTRHSVYISVICSVKIDMPLSKKSVNCITEVLVSEAVLVGEVPEIYFNSNK